MQNNKKVVEVTVKSLVDGEVNVLTGRGAVISVFENQTETGSEFTAALVGEFNYDAMMHSISNTVSSIAEGLVGKVDPFELERDVMASVKDGLVRGVANFVQKSGNPEMKALINALHELRG